MPGDIGGSEGGDGDFDGVWKFWAVRGGNWEWQKWMSQGAADFDGDFDGYHVILRK